MTSKTVSNNMGTFQVCVFEMAGEKEKPSETPIESSNDDTPDEWA
jgi:hypothetical protein